MTKLQKYLNYANRQAFKNHPPSGFARYFKLHDTSEKFILAAWELFRLTRDRITLDQVRFYVKCKKEGKDTLQAPDEYIPSSLRKVANQPKRRKEVAYAGGYVAGEGRQFAGVVGPCRDLIDVLEWVPDDDDGMNHHTGTILEAAIIRLNLDGTDEILYKWKWKAEKWKKVVKTN